MTFWLRVLRKKIQPYIIGNLGKNRSYKFYLYRLSKFFLALNVLFSIHGCGSNHKSFNELPPTPAGVSEELHKRCHSRGLNAGYKAVADMSGGAETFSMLTGGLGSILALSAAEAARNSAYSEAYKECLREGKTE